MGEYHQQQCPLCDTKAEFRNNDSDNYKLFHCSVCITFAISKTAEKRHPKKSKFFEKCSFKEKPRVERYMLVENIYRLDRIKSTKHYQIS